MNEIEATALNTDEFHPVQQRWVMRLTYMQQSVLFSALRNPDGFPKRHPAKGLMRWYRRCVLLSAFDGKALTDPNAPGGGSFTGTLSNSDLGWTLEYAADAFLDARDEMTLHFYAHFMHAAEIVGYKHPDYKISIFWREIYARMCNALHMYPETEAAMDKRLGDKEGGWRARNDPSATCSD